MTRYGCLKTMENDDPTPEEIARFMFYVDKLPCGCRFWTGARSKGGGHKKQKWYGTFWWRGKSWRAHMWSHDKLGKKFFKPGHHRDHSCVFSMCVNPDHIDAVPPLENEKLKRQRVKLTRKMRCD